MIKTTALIGLVLLWVAPIVAQSIVLDGTNFGQNIYIKSPWNTFCIDSVRVNGRFYTGNVNKSIFTISPDSTRVNLGERQVIEVFHSPHCAPQFLNSGAILTSETTVSNVQLDSNGRLSWTGSNDQTGRRLPFKVEHFLVGSWVTVQQIDQKWKTINQYETSISLHAGNNYVKISGFNADAEQSEVKIWTTSSKPALKIDYDPVKKIFQLNQSSPFVILNNKGNEVQSGQGDRVDFSELEPGEYWIFMADQTIHLVEENFALDKNDD